MGFRLDRGILLAVFFLIGLGLVHGRLGHLSRAVEAFEKALSLEPLSEEAHCNLAHCHALLGDLARAEHHGKEAMRLDPTCPHVHRHLAVGYLLAGQPRRSLDAWRAVEAREAEHPELAVGRARAYVALRRRDEARQAFVAALPGKKHL